MTNTILITICILLLLAYVFDISSSRTRIPSVILLLILGWAARQGSEFFGVLLPDLTPVLSILGTLGLILIVLEGALELEINKSKLPLIGKSSLISLLPMLLLSFSLAFAFQYIYSTTLKIGLANAIPFAVISSAIAIPSVKHLTGNHKEFVTYESSLSDIFGVIFFNFIILNEMVETRSFGVFVLEFTLILVVTFIATIVLSILLKKIKHHVKFVPIILMVVLIYGISKVYHLPSLVFILLFGLFLGNIEGLQKNKLMQRLHPDILKTEVKKFMELTAEITFLIRALFFLLFGYLLRADELLNSETILWALCISVGIYVIRYGFLKLFKLPLKPLLFIAPRGLITILLFLSIPATQTIEMANKSLIIQVIILTALIMMFGLMFHKNGDEPENDQPVIVNPPLSQETPHEF